MADAAFSSRIDLLSNVRLFASLNEEDLCRLARGMKQRVHPRGEVIYHQDDPAGSLFILSKGLVKIQLTSPAGGHVTFALIWPGGIFGTISPVDEGPRAESAAALKPSEVLILEGSAFRSVLRSNADVALTCLEIMATRRRRTTRQLYDALFLDIPARLSKVLLEYSSEPFLAPDGSCALDHLSQSELASMVWATRESTSKWLHFFERSGWIRLRREGVEILRPDMLSDRVEAGTAGRVD